MPRLPRELENLARMLAYMLGRRPDEFGLVLAEGGWMAVKPLLQRSEERRVGKECRSRWSPYH